MGISADNNVEDQHICLSDIWSIFISRNTSNAMLRTAICAIILSSKCCFHIHASAFLQFHIIPKTNNVN